MIAQGAPNHGTLVENLAGHHLPDQRTGPRPIVGCAVLGPAEQHVSRDRAFNAGEEAAGAAHHRDAHPLTDAMTHERRRHSDGTETNDAPKQMYRYPPALGPFDLDHRILAVLVQPRVLCRDVQGVQMPAHGHRSVIDGSDKPPIDGLAWSLRMTHFLQ